MWLVYSPVQNCLLNYMVFALDRIKPFLEIMSIIYHVYECLSNFCLCFEPMPREICANQQKL